MITSSLSDFIRTTKGVQKFEGYVHNNYPQKPNILMGFGLVSKTHGLSEFMPIELYNMLLVAEDLRRKVSPIGAKIHIIIPDNLARECQHSSCEVLRVEAMIQKYKNKINNIIKNLGVEEHYILHMGSDILVSKEYADIRLELEQLNHKLESYSKDTQNILKCNGYDKNQQNYFFDQITMMRYLYQHHHCGVKISWSRSGTPKTIKESKSFDEPHFDRFYNDLCRKDGMSFLYTKPGYVANVNGGLGVSPYNAPKIEGTERVSLHYKGPILNCVVNEKLVESILDNAALILSLYQEGAAFKGNSFSFHDNVNLLRQFARNPKKIKEMQMTNESLFLKQFKVPS